MYFSSCPSCLTKKKKNQKLLYGCPWEIRLQDTFAGFFLGEKKRNSPCIGFAEVLEQGCGRVNPVGAPVPGSVDCEQKRCQLPLGPLPTKPKPVPRVRNSVVISQRWLNLALFPSVAALPGGLWVARAELLPLAHSAVIVWRSQGAVPEPALGFEARHSVIFPLHRGRSSSQPRSVSLGLS